MKNLFSNFTLEGLRIFLEKVTAVIVHANPAVYSLIETTLPYTTPTPIAVISMTSATAFFGLKGFAAFLFVYSLEGIGLVATSKLVENIIAFIKNRNPKILLMTLILVGVVYAYITILVDLNVRIHNEQKNPNFSQVLTLICYLPLIAGVLNGLSLVKLDAQKTSQAAQEQENTLRQEQRADKMQRWMIKHGIVPTSTPAQTPPAPDEKAAKMPGDYRDFVMSLLDETHGQIELTAITERVNKEKRVKLKHADAKGTWHKYKIAWQRDHPN